MIPSSITACYTSLDQVMVANGFLPECDGWYKNKHGFYFYVENVYGHFYVTKFAQDPRPGMVKAMTMPVITF